MKKFKNFGYKQETIEVREISMGNLVHIICQALIAKDKKDMEIRIVDCYAGEVDVYNGMEDLLMQDFIFDWKVKDGKKSWQTILPKLQTLSIPRSWVI